MPSPAGTPHTASVLFADISGFTTLSERMDPEDVRDVIDALFQRFRTCIEREGGTVDKFIGDAVMAVFGAPTAHPDDPSRAVRTALALQRELAATNRERSLDLKLRVGVHSGEVFWGSVAGDRPTAMGDSVAIAQRLEGACPLGGVLVSRAVADAVGAEFMLTRRDPVTIRGREEAVFAAAAKA